MRLSLPATSRPTPEPRTRQLNVAHRGASAPVAENTLAALRRAAQAGADFVEVDVQRTRDGVLVLLHDPTLARTTNVREVFPDREPWSLADFTYDELCLLDAGSWKSPEQAGEPVPTLVEAIETVRRDGLGLLLELKAPQLYPGVVSDLVETLHGVSGYVEQAVADDRLVVQSFHVASMKEHKTLMPSVPVGLLGSPARENLAALATWADQVNPHHLAVDRAYVDHVHRLGMACQVWTVNRPPAMRRALGLGVDGVITNRPGELGAVLADRATTAPAGR